MRSMAFYKNLKKLVVRKMYRSPGYYYMSSSSITSYNENDATTKCKKKIRVNNNGQYDKYYKESIIEKDGERIVKEEGNRELDTKRIMIPNFFEEWNRLMDAFWNSWPRLSFFDYPTRRLEKTKDAQSESKSVKEPKESDKPTETKPKEKND